MKKWSEDKAFVFKYTALMVDGLVEQANKDGFNITKADAEKLMGMGGELSDEELSAVAGGATLFMKHVPPLAKGALAPF